MGTHKTSHSLTVEVFFIFLFLVVIQIDVHCDTDKVGKKTKQGYWNWNQINRQTLSQNFYKPY